MTRTRLFACLTPAVLVLACGDDPTDKKDAGTQVDAMDARAGGGGAGGGGSGGTGAGGSGMGGGGSGGTGAGGVGTGGRVGTGGSGGRADAAAGLDVGTRIDGGVDAPMDTPVDAPTMETSIAVDAGRDLRDGAGEAARRDVALDVGVALLCGPFADGGSPVDAGGAPSPTMSFFVSSSTSATGNLGGLTGADQRCQNLAQAVGLPSPLWRAYLSVEHDPPGTGAPVHARDRIGTGPWFNARGALIATNLTDLHARAGDASLFIDEHGNMINGQWTRSPVPNEHDILTGSNPDGTVAVGKTCADWSSAAGPSAGGVPDGGGGLIARVGHSDGIGPQCSTATSPTNYTSWNSSHDNAGCNDTAPRGGAGRIYCFKAN